MLSRHFHLHLTLIVEMILQFSVSASTTMGGFFNSSISPCDEFYAMACGVNVKNLREPPLKRIEDVLNTRIEKLLYQDKSNDEPVSVHKVKDVFGACMDDKYRKSKGNAELMKTIDKLGGWPILQSAKSSVDNTSAKWETVAGQLRRLGYSLLFRMNVNVDKRNSNKHIIVIDSLPAEIIPNISREMLNSVKAIAAHSTFIKNVALLLGATDVEIIKRNIKDILGVQVMLNKISNTNQKKTFQESYQVMTIAELNQLSSQNLDWIHYLNTIFDGLKIFGPSDEVAVLNADYIRNLGEFLGNTDSRVLRNYFLWRFIKDVAEDGDPAMVSFNMFLNGHSRLETCIKETKGFLGFAVLNMYLRNTNYEPRLSMALEISKWVKTAFEELINKSSWMDLPTKVQAISKLRKMTLKIGFPDWVLDPQALDKYYNQVTVSSSSHFANIMHLSTIYSLEELALINSSPDHESWVVSPIMVNAFYHSILNDIYIPMGVMEEPFLDSNWPMEANFGAIGSVIGHEISHGFDKETSRISTSTSNKFPWSPLAAARYDKAAQCVTRQYNSYCPLTWQESSDGSFLCVDGERTLRENVADIGGVRASFKAYQLWRQKHGGETTSATNYSTFASDQLFFVHFARIWCEDSSPASLVTQLETSLNSPNKYRLIGSLESFKEFSEVFHCNTSNRKQTSCDIW